MILFLNGVFAHVKDIPLRDKENLSIVASSLFESLRRYNEKFGIKFVAFNELLSPMALHIFIRLRASYTDYLALKDLFEHNYIESEISQFVSNRIQLIFNLARPLKAHSIHDLFNLVGIYVDAFCIVMSLSNKEALFLPARNKLERECQNLAELLSKQTDIKRALGEHAKRMADAGAYSSFKSFVNTACASFVDFFGSVEPQYVWLEEAGMICRAGNWFLDQIEKDPYGWHPQLGSVDDFTELLHKVFDKITEFPKIYPELPLTCGYVLLQLLLSMARFRKDKKCFQNALKIGQQLSDSIIKNTKEIKRKNPQSPFGYFQGALILVGLAKASSNFQNWKAAKILLNKAEAIAEEYDLSEIKLLVHWSRFLLAHDYEELLQVYRLYSNVERKNDLGFQHPSKITALLSAGVFEEKNKLKHYSGAVSLSLSPVFSDAYQVGETDLQDNLFTQRLSCYISNLFLHVAKAEEQKSIDLMRQILREAKPYAMALETETSSSSAPENIFAWKTTLIIAILDNNKNKALESIKKLQKSPPRSSTNEYFLNKAKAFIQFLETKDWNSTLDILDMPVEKRDPWSRLLERFVETEFKRLIIQRLKLISRAILFVEGPTEVEILPILANKIGINLKELGIGLISLRGSSKAKYHLRLWREITKNASLPLFMLVDLDAKNETRKAVEEGLVRKNNCFVLSLGSIEDYYPSGPLIKAIEELCGRKPTPDDLVGPKVHTIDSFLKRNSYTKDWKIPIGCRVACLMDKIEVHSEIHEILNRILDATASPSNSTKKRPNPS